VVWRGRQKEGENTLDERKSSDAGQGQRPARKREVFEGNGEEAADA